MVPGSLRAIEQEESNSGVEVQGVVMAQENRKNSKAEVQFKPTQRIDGNGVIPGYRGHVPNVVNAIGMSTFLSGPGFTEVLVENMEKMGGAGDLGDSAAAYGCNDWGASSFSDDGNAEFKDLGAGPMADGHASALEKSSMAGGTRSQTPTRHRAERGQAPSQHAGSACPPSSPHPTCLKRSKGEGARRCRLHAEVVTRREHGEDGRRGRPRQ